MYDLIIIGSGPAGQTAALYASRAGLKVLIIEKGAPGGKVFLTHKVENYPGYKSISGRELANLMQEHAVNFGAECIYGDVLEIKENKTVVTNMGTYEGRAVLIATGTENTKLEVDGEVRLNGKGVSYCAVCDGNFFKGKDVAVIGGGNSALEESIYLAGICNSVTLIHRRDEFKAESFIVKKFLEIENIHLELNSRALDFVGENKLETINVENIITGETKELHVDGVFIYVGLHAQVSQFANVIELDEHKSIIVNEHMETSVEGIYAAGDCTRKPLRQIATAVNDGAVAAQAIINYLNVQ